MLRVRLLLILIAGFALLAALPAAAQTNTPTFTPTFTPTPDVACSYPEFYLSANPRGSWNGQRAANPSNAGADAYEAGTNTFLDTDTPSNLNTVYLWIYIDDLDSYSSLHVYAELIQTRSISWGGGNYQYWTSGGWTGGRSSGGANPSVNTIGTNLRRFDYPADVDGGYFEGFFAVGSQTANDAAEIEVYQILVCVDTPTPTPTPTPDPLNANFTASPTSGDRPLAVTFTNTSTGAVSYEWDFDDDGTVDSTATNPTHTFMTEGVYFVRLTAISATSATDEHDVQITVGDIGVPGGTLYRPLADSTENDYFHDDGLWSIAADQSGSGLLTIVENALEYIGLPGVSLDSTNQHTVYAHSDQVGERVYAVADGEVTNIEKISSNADCPAGFALAGQCVILYINSDTLIPQINLLLVDLAPVWRVDVEYDTGETIRYYVANPNDYVFEGVEVRAGCIIGETYQPQARTTYIGVSLGGEATFEVSPEFLGGVMMLELIEDDSEDQLPIIHALTFPPEPNNACNADTDIANCAGDPYFRQPGQWTLTGGARFENGALVLPPFSSARYSGLPLSESVQYSMWVNAAQGNVTSALFPRSARLTIGIGQTLTSYYVTPEIEEFEVSSALHSPDEGSLYSVSLAQTGGTYEVLVYSHCLSDDILQVPPGICYFQNYSFDGRLSPWSSSGSVTYTNAQPGEILVGDDGIFGQNVTLYPEDGGGAHSYLVAMQIYFYASSTPSPAPSFQMQYRINNGSWVNFGSSVTWAAGVNSAIGQEITQSISINAETIGSLEFSPAIDPNGFGGTLQVRVREVCIKDDFDHHGGPGGGFVVPVPDDTSLCTKPSRPDGAGVDAWISYLWLNLRNVYYCDVIPQLEDMERVAREQLALFRWSVLYAQTADDRLARWAEDQLFPWLGGHLSNIALNRVSVVQDGQGECSDLWCVLRALIDSILAPIVNLLTEQIPRIIDLLLQMVSRALDLLFTVLDIIVRLFVSVFNVLISFFNLLRSLVESLTLAFNDAEPVPIPILPQCQLDVESAVCFPLWALENTIFAEEGALIIPLIVGILSLLHIRWMLEKLSAIFEKIGGSL